MQFVDLRKDACMLNQCATCKDGKQDSGEEVEVSRWQKATVDDRWKKVKLIMPVDDAVKANLYALSAFSRHVYLKRCQEVAYQQEIEESSATKSVVQIHFAGNYTCVFQDEVQ